MKNAIITLLVALTALFALTGCDTVTEYDGAGNVTKVTKASPLKDDILVNSTNATGIVVETSVSSSSENVLPSFRIWTGGNSLVKQNKDCGKLIFTSTVNAGVLTSLTNASAESNTKIFVGASGDTGAGAAKFIAALALLKSAENGTAAVAADVVVSAITDSAGTTYSRYEAGDNSDAAYAWKSSGETPVTVYTASTTPIVGDGIYSDKELKTQTDTVKSRTAE